MRSQFARGLVAAMENEELKTPADVPAEEIGAGADSLETELAEVVSEQVEGDAAQAATDEAVETSEALESMILALEAAVQNGGLDKAGAAVLNVGLESIYGRVGLVPKKPRPALENYGGASSRQGATQMALEGIKEEAKRIWEAIKAAIKKAIDWVVGYWNKFFGAAEKLKKRADALASRAGSTNGKVKESTFEDERLVKALHIGGKVPASVDLAKNVFTTAEALFKAYDSSVVQGGNNLVSSFEKLDAKAAKDSLNVMVTPVGGSSKVGNPEGEGFGAAAGADLFRSTELPGGKAILTYVPLATDDGINNSAGQLKAGGVMGDFNPKAKEVSGGKLTTLSPADAEKIAEIVADIAGALAGFRDKSGKGTELQKKMLAAADKLEKAASDEKAGEGKDNLKYFQKLASNTAKLFNQPYVGFSTYALQVCKAILDYVELSLKQYSEE